ncbi:hypothetical protein Dda_8404 [Drechslerella dactyloides]|uniref:Uncharacterized protein n=1 Tax=Drechslerella dactyloides TaxID=74499 RepID=A0AAD6IU90_DREDA|nr:hypothetical protein Dda_8404 [Drechslerella dactyloides]
MDGHALSVVVGAPRPGSLEQIQVLGNPDRRQEVLDRDALQRIGTAGGGEAVETEAAIPVNLGLDGTSRRDGSHIDPGRGSRRQKGIVETPALRVPAILPEGAVHGLSRTSFPRGRSRAALQTPGVTEPGEGGGDGVASGGTEPDGVAYDRQARRLRNGPREAGEVGGPAKRRGLDGLGAFFDRRQKKNRTRASNFRYNYNRPWTGRRERARLHHLG